MKKIISIILLISIVLTYSISGFAAPVVAENSQADDVLISKAEALIELGIIKSFSANADVSKSTVVKSLEKITGTNLISNKFLGEVYDDAVITTTQFAAMMLELAGYTEFATIKNGAYNLASVYSFASKIDIIDKGIKSNVNMNMSMFVSMLYNTLFEVDVMEAVGFGEDINYEINKDKTVINKYMNIVTVEGVVYGAEKLNMTAKEEAGSEHIRIDNKIYQYKKLSDPDQYAGRFVEAYIDEANMNRILALRIVPDMNEILELESVDIVMSSVTETSLQYYNSAKRKKTMSISPTADVIYNGELLVNYNRNDLCIEDAYYTFVNSDNNKDFETIIINKYTPVMVWRASDGEVSHTVTDYNNNTYDLNDFVEEGYPFIEADGTPVIWRELSQYDILSLRITKSGEINKIIHSIEKINGIYGSSSKNSNSIMIDDEKYYVTSEFENNRLMHAKIDIGDEVSFFLDAFGRVVGAIPYIAEAQMAAVMGIADESGLSGYKIKYLSETDGIVIADINSKIMINGTTRSSDDIFGTNSPLFFNSDGSIKQQLVKIKTNSKGEVKSIETADESKVNQEIFGYDKLTLFADYTKGGNLKTATVNGTLLGNTKYIFDTDTVTFVVCTDDELRCEVIYGGPVDTFYGKTYNVDEDYHVGYTVYYTDVSRLDEGWVNMGATMSIVESHSIISHPHKEGEIAYAIRVWDGDESNQIRPRTLICEDPNKLPTNNINNYMAYASGNNFGNPRGQLGQKLCEEVENVWMKTKWSEIPPGSIIMAYIDNGVVTNYVIQYLAGTDFIFEGMENNLIEGSVMIGGWNYGVTEKLFYGPTILSAGYVQQANRFGIVVNNHLPTDIEGIDSYPIASWNRSIPMEANKKIYVVDTNDEREMIKLGNTSDIRQGDKVFMKNALGSTKMVVVYR